jgi:hypothetical protein
VRTAAETGPSVAEPEPKTTALFQQILTEIAGRETSTANG